MCVACLVFISDLLPFFVIVCFSFLLVLLVLSTPLMNHDHVFSLFLRHQYEPLRSIFFGWAFFPYEFSWSVSHGVYHFWCVISGWWFLVMNHYQSSNQRPHIGHQKAPQIQQTGANHHQQTPSGITKHHETSSNTPDLIVIVDSQLSSTITNKPSLTIIKHQHVFPQPLIVKHQPYFLEPWRPTSQSQKREQTMTQQ